MVVKYGSYKDIPLEQFKSHKTVRQIEKLFDFINYAIDFDYYGKHPTKEGSQLQVTVEPEGIKGLTVNIIETKACPEDLLPPKEKVAGNTMLEQVHWPNIATLLAPENMKEIGLSWEDLPLGSLIDNDVQWHNRSVAPLKVDILTWEDVPEMVSEGLTPLLIELMVYQAAELSKELTPKTSSFVSSATRTPYESQPTEDFLELDDPKERQDLTQRLIDLLGGQGLPGPSLVSSHFTASGAEPANPFIAPSESAGKTKNTHDHRLANEFFADSANRQFDMTLDSLDTATGRWSSRRVVAGATQHNEKAYLVSEGHREPFWSEDLSESLTGTVEELVWDGVCDYLQQDPVRARKIEIALNIDNVPYLELGDEGQELLSQLQDEVLNEEVYYDYIDQCVKAELGNINESFKKLPVKLVYRMADQASPQAEQQEATRQRTKRTS